MDSENRTAVKLMIAALENFHKARMRMSGLGWAELVGSVDRSYYPGGFGQKPPTIFFKPSINNRPNIM